VVIKGMERDGLKGAVLGYNKLKLRLKGSKRVSPENMGDLDKYKWKRPVAGCAVHS
jgi:hypothetical protein